MSDPTEIIKRAEEVLAAPITKHGQLSRELARAVVEMGKELKTVIPRVVRFVERIRELEQQLATLKHAICPDDSITDIAELEDVLVEDRAVTKNYVRLLDLAEKKVEEYRYRLQTWDDVHAERQPPR